MTKKTVTPKYDNVANAYRITRMCKGIETKWADACPNITIQMEMALSPSRDGIRFSDRFVIAL